MAETPETRYAQNGDVSIAYQVLGDGPPDVVFSSCLGSQLEMLWEEPSTARFLRRLTSFSRLILYDRRGLGLSDRGTPASSVDEELDDLRAVLDAAGARAVAHFSCCVSGRLSLVFAASHPERTTALVLFDSHPATVRDDDYPFGTTASNNEARATEYASSWGDNAYQTSHLRRMAPSAADDESIQRWYARMSRASASPAEMARRTRRLRDIDVRYVLPTVGVPTLILHRVGDTQLDIGASRYLAERIPGARLVELEGADHLPMFGDADAVVDEVQEFLTGIRPGPAADRVLATVLFTDIVDSTRHAARLGDHRWLELLDRQNAMVRSQLARFGGREIETTGDGFLAVFESPTRAIGCARGVAAEAQALGLQLRCGLHTGECERSGKHVRGIAVHIAARVSSMAGPGEVLVSRTVTDLVAGSGIDFADRGDHELKGVPGRWQLFAVEA